MLIVAGLTLKNLHPRVWDPESPYHLPDLEAVMVSYAEFHRLLARRREAMRLGLHAYLGIPPAVKVYLDNGAFSFLSRGAEVPRDEYEAFVGEAQPDWFAIPQDYIPTPAMAEDQQRECLRRTMEVNLAYRHDGYVPVIHASRLLDDYLERLQEDEQLRAKPTVGLGALVPNLLRAPKAEPYQVVLNSLQRVRQALAGKQLHVFGLGGTATLHLAALLGIDSLDSSGWRNRAAYGLVQLPGRGDRMVVQKGNWRGREPSVPEIAALANCTCPACCRFGLAGLYADGLFGFSNRATHNLWTLLQEAGEIAQHLADGTYASWYAGHLDNTVYLPLIRRLVGAGT